MWLISGLQWLIVTVLSMYILLVLLRFMLQWQRISLLNPLGQAAMQLTEKPISFIRRYIRSSRHTDWPALALAIVLSIIMVGVQYRFHINPIALILIGIIQMISLGLSLYFYALLALIILSWVSPHHRLLYLVNAMVQPILQPFQRAIPPIGGLDLAPIATILVLKFTELFILGGLSHWLLGW